MSLWLYKKDKDGKPYVIAVEIMPAILPVIAILGLLAAMLFPSLHQSGPLGSIQFFLWSGPVCLFATKVSLFRRGVWFSLGPGQMTRRWSGVYKAGYALMGIGTLMAIAAFRAAH